MCPSPARHCLTPLGNLLRWATGLSASVRSSGRGSHRTRCSTVCGKAAWHATLRCRLATSALGRRIGRRIGRRSGRRCRHTLQRARMHRELRSLGTVCHDAGQGAPSHPRRASGAPSPSVPGAVRASMPPWPRRSSRRRCCRSRALASRRGHGRSSNARSRCCSVRRMRRRNDAGHPARSPAHAGTPMRGPAKLAAGDSYAHRIGAVRGTGRDRPPPGGAPDPAL